jgi:glycosyltransferase involved in cell wall biosynthesis
VNTLQALAGTLQSQLEAAEQDRAQKQSAIEQLHAFERQLRELEQQRQAETAQRDVERAEADARNARLTEQIREAEERLRLCKAACTDLIASTAEQLRKRDERFGRLETAFRAMLNRQRAELEQAEARQQAELDSLHGRLAELPKLGALGLAQKHELEILRPYASDLEHRLNAVLSSTSWHLTGPLRGFTERHPGAVRPLRNFLHEHPGIRRNTVGLLRMAWRTMTLRNPVALRRLPDKQQPAPSDTPAELSHEAPPQLELKLVSIEPAVRSRERSLPARGHRKALCVGHVMPYPPRAGNEYRIHRLLSSFAEDGWELLVVICPLPHEIPSREQMASAAAIYPNLLILERDGTLHHHLQAGDGLLQRDLKEYAPKLKRLLDAEGHGSDRVLNLQRTFCPDILALLLFHLEDKFAPHLLLAEYIFMTRPFPLLNTRLRKAVDTIDVFSTKARKVEQFAVTDGLALTAEEERPLVQRADILVAIQPEEAQALEQLAPRATVVSVGVDFPVVVPDEGSAPGGAILLVASANPMNVKGLEDFLQFAWPTVRRYEPEAEFVIAGSVAETMTALPDGVRAVGRVDDLRPLYAEARLVINPAVAGTGLKIKTVEALCHLCPVVCWPTGAEGLPTEVRRFCAISTDWFSFARNVADQLRTDEAALAVRRARNEIARVFSPEFVYAPLRAVLDDA